MDKNNTQLLYNIDKAIKRCREIENNKFPYAIILNSKFDNNLQIESFLYLSKKNFKNIPIIKNKELNTNFQLIYSEEELPK